MPLLDTSLAAILDVAPETGGEISHLETGRLAQLLLRDEDGGHGLLEDRCGSLRNRLRLPEGGLTAVSAPPETS